MDAISSPDRGEQLSEGSVELPAAEPYRATHTPDGSETSADATESAAFVDHDFGGSDAHASPFTDHVAPVDAAPADAGHAEAGEHAADTSDFTDAEEEGWPPGDDS